MNEQEIQDYIKAKCLEVMNANTNKTTQQRKERLIRELTNYVTSKVAVSEAEVIVDEVVKDDGTATITIRFPAEVI